MADLHFLGFKVRQTTRKKAIIFLAILLAWALFWIIIHHWG